MLTHNAKNLISAIEEVLYATERAIIKLAPSEMKELNLISHGISCRVLVFKDPVNYNIIIVNKP